MSGAGMQAGAAPAVGAPRAWDAVASVPGAFAVRAAMQACLRGDGPESELRAALQVFCVAVRARGLEAQHVIVALKELWASLPEACGYRDPQAAALRDRLVTAGIEEFYAAPSAGTPRVG